MKYISILSMSIYLSSCCWVGHCNKNPDHKKNQKQLPEPMSSQQWMPSDMLVEVMKDFPTTSNQ